MLPVVSQLRASLSGCADGDDHYDHAAGDGGCFRVRGRGAANVIAQLR